MLRVGLRVRVQCGQGTLMPSSLKTCTGVAIGLSSAIKVRSGLVQGHIFPNTELDFRSGSPPLSSGSEIGGCQTGPEPDQ